MHRRDLRLCQFVGVAPVKRFIFLLLLSSSFQSFASTLITWTFPGANGGSGNYSTPLSACRQGTQFPSRYITKSGSTQPYDGGDSANCNTAAGQYLGTVYKGSQSCPFGDNGTQCNASCDLPKIMSGGQCITPPTCDASKGETLVDGACVVTNQCAAKKDQTAPFIQKYPSFDAYKPSCTGSVDGCAIDTCSGASQCGTNGETGEFACWGTGKYSGEQQAVSDGTALNPPPIPEPTTTGSSQSCTAPAVNNGTTTYTCVTESNATEFASSNCAVGTVNGVQGLHCTKPDYVPEHDSKKREDQVSEVTNPDGSKTTTTTSTTTTTHCAAGACTTTNTTTITTSGKDANGNPTGTTTTCSGDKCDNPTTPGKDESEEEEEEEGEMPAPFAPGDKGDYLPQIAEGDEAPTYSESLDNFTDRVSNAPIVRGLTSISVPSGGSCSMGSAQLFGGSVSFNDFCTMAPQVLAGLRYLFLAIWAWAAIRLFFTA